MTRLSDGCHVARHPLPAPTPNNSIRIGSVRFSAPPACENVIKISGEFYCFGCFDFCADFAWLLLLFLNVFRLRNQIKDFFFIAQEPFVVWLFVCLAHVWFLFYDYYRFFAIFPFVFLKIAVAPKLHTQTYKRLRQRTCGRCFLPG